MGDQAQNCKAEFGQTFPMKKLFKKYFLAKKKWRVFPYKTWTQSSESA